MNLYVSRLESPYSRQIWKLDGACCMTGRKFVYAFACVCLGLCVPIFCVLYMCLCTCVSSREIVGMFAAYFLETTKRRRGRRGRGNDIAFLRSLPSTGWRCIRRITKEGSKSIRRGFLRLCWCVMDRASRSFASLVEMEEHENSSFTASDDPFVCMYNCIFVYKHTTYVCLCILAVALGTDRSRACDEADGVYLSDPGKSLVCPSHVDGFNLTGDEKFRTHDTSIDTHGFLSVHTLSRHCHPFHGAKKKKK